MAEDVSSASAESNGGSSLGAFLKWAGGIVSAVLIGVLTFWLTRTPTPPQPAPTVPPVGLNGVVANSDTHVLIGSATVAVTLGPNTVQQTTDPLGRYSVVLAPVGPDANMGTVKIAAPGYQEYENTVALQPGDNYAEIAIDPVPVVTAAVPPAAEGGNSEDNHRESNPSSAAGEGGDDPGEASGDCAEEAAGKLREESCDRVCGGEEVEGDGGWPIHRVLCDEWEAECLRLRASRGGHAAEVPHSRAERSA
jgi:hypothetical protein